MKNMIRTDPVRFGTQDKVEIRKDIPEEFRQEIFRQLVLEYRQLLGGEPELIHTIEKATAIGMLENALRRKETLPLPVDKSWVGTRAI